MSWPSALYTDIYTHISIYIHIYIGSFQISQRIAAIDSKAPGISYKDHYKDQLILNLNALPSGKGIYV
jgi:hypothetical protein